MNSKLILSLIFVGFGVACGGDEDGARRSQQGYETVQEGSAAGVTSTIPGPGQPLPPLTGTNADTTTAFTIDPNAVASAPPSGTPGTLAGTMPPTTSPLYPPPMTSSPVAGATPPQFQPTASRPTSQPVRAQPPPQREPAAPVTPAPATDTAENATPKAPPTPTAPPTNTAPPPPPQQEEEVEEEEEEPPPPTSTDTRGGQR